jgi:hypothetical protein
MTTQDYFDALPWITVQDEKVLAHRDDFVSEQGWRVATKLIEPGLLLFNYSFILIKPEAKARRLSSTILTYLCEKGFRAVASINLILDRGAGHAIWRYQWNAATTDRIELTNLIHSQSESTLVLLRDIRPSEVPASVKLWALKGSAHSDRRGPEHLRSILNMHNRMIGFVHLPDEPADFIRELSILLDPDSLADLLQRTLISDGAQEKVVNAVLGAEAATKPHSILPSEVTSRLSHLLPGTVRSWLEQGQRVSLAAVADQVADRTSRWDFLTLAAELIFHDKPGGKPRLDARAVHEVQARWAELGRKIRSRLKETCYE